MGALPRGDEAWIKVVLVWLGVGRWGSICRSWYTKWLSLEHEHQDQVRNGNSRQNRETIHRLHESFKT